MSDKKRIDNRVCNFELICYEDSLPSNWLDVLTDLKLPVVVSPLHDSDLKTDSNGLLVPKKPHYHVYIMYPSKKDISQVYSDINGLVPLNLIQRVRNIRSAIRYTIHIDYPDKAQYSLSDVRAFGDINLAKYFDESCKTDAEYATLSAIYELIKNKNITEFRDLIDLLNDNGAYEMMYLCSRKYCQAIHYYLSSSRFSSR